MANKHRSEEGLCPFYCKKLKSAESDIENLQQVAESFIAYKNIYNHLIQILVDGQIILGLTHIDNLPVVVAMRKSNDGCSRDIFLYDASDSLSRACICKMFLEFIDDQTVKIADWYSYVENRGYGSYFLQTVINYLRREGYSYIRGFIGVADYDHLEKLYHLYGKFGFEITSDKKLLLRL